MGLDEKEDSGTGAGKGSQLVDGADKGMGVSAREALPLAAEMAEALEKAHGQGIVHRDLKPSNIMLSTEGHPKIMDFGLAKRVTLVEGVESQDQTQTELTREGSTLGMPAYLSPEQVLGQSVDARSDIFSFGIVLYEMLTGAHPFRRSHAVETAGAILRDEPMPLAHHLPGVSELLEHVVGKSLAKDPGQRYQSARELQVDLKRLAEGSWFSKVLLPSISYLDSRSLRPRRSKSRRSKVYSETFFSQCQTLRYPPWS